MKTKLSIYLTLIFFLFSPELSMASAGETKLHSLWSELLASHVRDGVVDYQGLKREEKKLDRYLHRLDASNPDTMTETDRLALYINGYNAYTVKLILDNFKGGKPVASIKKLGGLFSGPWKISFCRIGGKVYTLDNIEHDIIRTDFKEPRIHFAVNCASKSCPPLLATAYEGARIDEQLEERTVAFINNPKFNYLESDVLYVSKIFKWFSGDFENVLGFIQEKARGELKVGLERLGGGVRMRYMEYNWSLNN